MFAIKKLAVFGTALLSIEVLNHGFDYLLYPVAILYFGIVKGWVIMTTIALLLNYLLIRIYTKSKFDWYGFESLRLQAEKQKKGWRRNLINLGRVSAFALLSWEDPFKAYIFARGKQSAGHRFNRTDWLTFLGANLLGNMIWAGMLGAGWSIIKRIILR